MYDDSIAVPEAELSDILDETQPGDPLFPELDHIQAARETPPAELMLHATEDYLPDIEHIPQITYSLYREYRRTGYWQNYGRTYFQKRANLTAAALRTLLGEGHWLDVVQDYVWSLCEETNWVISYHEPREVDLFSAETAAMLAQLITALDGSLVDEVGQRTRDEIERRVLVPYLERHTEMNWFKGTNNWNGVCNGSIGTAFLLLERHPDRLAKALALVLDSLDVFVHTAFEEDGASTEGPGYWQYGLLHFVVFSELLRERTRGRVDLLANERMRAIAAYPLKLMLSPGRYANFSDCEERVRFQPGFICRLAERTGVHGLVGVLAQGKESDVASRPGIVPAGLMRWNLDIALRTLLWWDGHRPTPSTTTDAHLPSAGTVRLVAQTPDGCPTVVALKAGHNAENHNHNDVGSLILHVDGETFLCDPGRGLYDSTYFTRRRYENPFASSYGHSVPRIGNQTQSAGRQFCGEVIAYEPAANPKRVVAEIGAAYDVPHLESVRRTVALGHGSTAGTVWLEDRFSFADRGSEVEEALVTWLEPQVCGAVAALHGDRHTVRFTIEAPADAAFVCTDLAEECRANEREGVLRRLTFGVPRASDVLVRVRIDVE